MPRGERDFLTWTEELDLLTLDNHDLPKATGFVESNRRYVLTRFVEHFGAIAHRSPSPFSFVILHFPEILMRQHGGAMMQDKTCGNNGMLVAVLESLATIPSRPPEASMRLLRLCTPRLSVIVLLAIMFALSSVVSAQSGPSPSKKPKSGSCLHDVSGLKLPAGFCATVFAEGIGHARHLVVSPGGVVYVNTWSGDYYDFDKPHDGGFLVALQDKTGTGKADVIQRFGETAQTGGAGGVGIGM